MAYSLLYIDQINSHELERTPRKVNHHLLYGIIYWPNILFIG